MNTNKSVWKEFLWLIAGSDKEILQECPILEQNKHAGIGAMILITAIIACLSGGYAIYTLANSYLAAIVLGLFWGIVVLTVDRLLVSTIKKDKNDNKWREFKYAVPRILLALGIAFVISKPVEVKVLEDQINRYLQHTNLKEEGFLNSGYASNLEIDKLTAEIGSIDKKLKQLKEERSGIRNEQPYSELQGQETTCKQKVSNYGIQIDLHRSEIRQIENVQHPNVNYRTTVTLYVTSDNTKYKDINKVPPGSTIQEKLEREKSPEGQRRINQLTGLIGDLRVKIRDLNCGNYTSKMGEYYEDRDSDIKRRENEQRILNLKKDSLLQIRQIKLDSIKEVNAEILAASSKGFIGKLFALERAKDEQQLFGVKKDTVKTTPSVELPIKQPKKAFPDTLPVQYNIDISAMDYCGDTLDLKFPEQKKDLYLNYIREDAIIKDSEIIKPKRSFSFERNILWWVSNALLFFFFTIELLPIFVKIITDFGLYDNLIKSKDSRILEEHKKKNKKP